MKVEDNSSAMDRVVREFRKLDNMSVKVGALRSGGGRSDELMEIIAMANEFGAHIEAKSGKYLTIPTKEAGNRKATEIDGLFLYYTKANHYPTLAKSVDGQLKIYYFLKTSVNIPERSFLRRAFDQNESTKWNKRVGKDLEKMMDGVMTAKELYDDLGRMMVKDVQRAIHQAKPENSPLTVSTKGKDTPLEDTGALYRSIDWTVVKHG